MKPPKLLGVFSLAMINAAAIINLNNIPALAILGTGLVSYLLLATIFFFLPTAFISAELATGWPEEGGFYTWVRIAFGSKISFLAIWLQWIANVIWFPTLIVPITLNLMLLFFPNLHHQSWILVVCILVVFWGLTLANMRGMRSAIRISVIGVLLGTILPAFIILGCAIAWWWHSFPSGLSFKSMTLLPNVFHLDQLSIVVSIIVTLTGMEMSAVHVNNVINPRRSYPKAIFIATIIILITFVLTAFSIAMILSPEKINIVDGVLQYIQVFTHAMHISWLSKPFMLLVFLGILAMASTWIMGPSRALQIAAMNNEFPRFFQHKNKYNIPSRILLLQAIIFTVISLLFIFAPSIASSYWLLIALTGQLYMVMYFILFCTGLKLRLKHPHVARNYSIPGRYNLGMWLVCILGMIGTIAAFFVALYPPDQVQAIHSFHYSILLLGLFFIFCIVPLYTFIVFSRIKRNKAMGEK